MTLWTHSRSFTRTSFFKVSPSHHSCGEIFKKLQLLFYLDFPSKVNNRSYRHDLYFQRKLRAGIFQTGASHGSLSNTVWRIAWLEGRRRCPAAPPCALLACPRASIVVLGSLAARAKLVGSIGRLLNDLDGEPDSPSKGWLGHARGSIGARCARRRSDPKARLSAPYPRKVARRAGSRAGAVWLWRSDWVRGLTLCASIGERRSTRSTTPSTPASLRTTRPT